YVLDTARRPGVPLCLPPAQAHGPLRLRRLCPVQRRSGGHRAASVRPDVRLHTARDRRLPEAGFQGALAGAPEPSARPALAQAEPARGRLPAVFHGRRADAAGNAGNRLTAFPATDAVLQPVLGRIRYAVSICASAARIASTSVGRTSLATSSPRRRNTRVGQSLTRNRRPSRRPLPSAILMCRTDGYSAKPVSSSGCAALQ